MTKNVFLSHSSIDATFALLLSDEIKKAFTPNVEVFLSSRSDTIPSGYDWKTTVIDGLEQADALVILVTRSAENSMWIGFELGYFWKKNDGKRIHPLFHPTALLPSPLNILQGKKVIAAGEITSFFKQLATDLGETYKDVDISNIVEEAKHLAINPPVRSLANFERLLTKSKWEKTTVGGNEVWLCEEDVLFKILVDLGSGEDFEPIESWTKIFPSFHIPTKYPVYLQIEGQTIDTLNFIALDSGRYFVPMPDSEGTMNTEKYVWHRNSRKFKVATIISEFYRVYPSIEDFAKAAGIEITD